MPSYAPSVARILCMNSNSRRFELWLSGACVSLTWNANAGVSFASSDFKLRICAPLFFPRMEYYFPERIRNIQIKFQMSPNCHFDSLNLGRNSNLEFEFMHKIRATERA
jgi:hypothetical protein